MLQLQVSWNTQKSSYFVFINECVINIRIGNVKDYKFTYVLLLIYIHINFYSKFDDIEIKPNINIYQFYDTFKPLGKSK